MSRPHRAGRGCASGAAAIIICLGLMFAAGAVAAALQQMLHSRLQVLQVRWERLQAQALAEALLARTLAAFDDPRPVDAACRLSAGGTAERATYADRVRRPGARVDCRIRLEAGDETAGWSCSCNGSPVDEPSASGTEAAASDSTRPGPGHRVGWGTLQVQAVAAGASALLLRTQACTRRADSAPGCTPAAAEGAAWSESVLLAQPTASGPWKTVIGSWEGP